MNSVNPFKLLTSTKIYKNPWISVREDKVIRPGGKEGIFGVVEIAPGSSVLPMDDDGNVFLVKEYKYGIQRATVEVISGGMDKDETPLMAAVRELREEVGVEAKEWIELGSIDPFTTIVSSPNYLFLAKGLDHSEPKPDEGETLEHIKIPFKQALSMVRNGKITHAASCVLILRAQEFVSPK
jgi:8-oxo-dGTP pyrophosphatase MutT (NUDIX family)